MTNRLHVARLEQRVAEVSAEMSALDLDRMIAFELIERLRDWPRDWTRIPAGPDRDVDGNYTGRAWNNQPRALTDDEFAAAHARCADRAQGLAIDQEFLLSEKPFEYARRGIPEWCVFEMFLDALIADVEASLAADQAAGRGVGPGRRA